MIDMVSLSALLDDETLVRKYLTRFVDDMPGLIRKMSLAFESQQWSEISLHAHTYKSQVQYINDTHSIKLVHELEQCTSALLPDPTHIGQLITQLELQLNIIVEEIHQIL